MVERGRLSIVGVPVYDLIEIWCSLNSTFHFSSALCISEVVPVFAAIAADGAFDQVGW